jgi:hypothetical protein
MGNGGGGGTGDDDGESGGGKDGEGGGGSEEKEDEKKGKKGKGDEKKGRKEEGDVGEYDFADDFIDDGEFVLLLEHTDKRQLKHKGYFISRVGSLLINPPAAHSAPCWHAFNHDMQETGEGI